ncbi:MAG: 30S ribosomal protein S9 [Deltaproteobacteria bacterium]|nr:30S ribosomal protein S9 [Deltaproteobacteria bacterium]
MAENVFIAVGRRKTSVARAILSAGSGEITVNDKPMDKFFPRETLKMDVRRPFDVTKTSGKFNVRVNVKGGGPSGQAGAVRHAISRALIEISAENKDALKKAGFLTRDPRMKERKKYGQKGARARFQYSKR